MMMNTDETSWNDIVKEKTLRQLVLEKPRNAKAMSQLSSLLVDRSKIKAVQLHSNSNSVCTKLRDEAIQLAQHAIQVAPQRPFGYAALSVAANDWTERKQALHLAIDLSADHFRLARLGLLVRLLLEERIEEARQLQGTLGKGSPLHPNRRNLTIAETKLYERIIDDLRVLHETISTSITTSTTDILIHPTFSATELDFLYQQEFRLGQFFRKKVPTETHLPRAKHHLEQALLLTSSSPQQEMAKFWLSTLPNVVSVMDKCPATYVVGLYSTFAARFDTLLVEKLYYQTPTKLRQLLNDVTLQSFQKVCDLGCGTGLSGMAFQDRIQGTMVGVDLSPEMLQQAQTRGCYHALHVGDVEVLLRQLAQQEQQQPQQPSLDGDHNNNDNNNCMPPGFDLILACDVFCYIGDLSGIFKVATQSLTTGGYFIFSTELLQEKTEIPFRLHSCARFSHRQDYVEELAQRNELYCVKMQVATIRKNQGEDVKGLLVLLQKRC